jgi:hypothetical protein
VIVVAKLARGGLEPASITYVFTESGARDGWAVSDMAWFAGDPASFAVELGDEAALLPLEAPRLDLVAFRSRRSALRIVPGAPARVEPVELPAKGMTWLRAGGFVPVPSRIVAHVAQDVLTLEADGPLPEGLLVRTDKKLGSPLVKVVPAVAAGQKPAPLTLDEMRPLADLVLASEDGPALWERTPEDAARAVLLRAVVATADEARASGTPRGVPFPRTWLAVPIPAPALARAIPLALPFEKDPSGPVPPGGRAIAVLLVAVEEEP